MRGFSVEFLELLLCFFCTTTSSSPPVRSLGLMLSVLEETSVADDDDVLLREEEGPPFIVRTRWRLELRQLEFSLLESSLLAHSPVFSVVALVVLVSS